MRTDKMRMLVIIEFRRFCLTFLKESINQKYNNNLKYNISKFIDNRVFTDIKDAKQCEISGLDPHKTAYRLNTEAPFSREKPAKFKHALFATTHYQLNYYY